MADQVDGIEVIIDVDTLAVLKAGKEVKRTNDEMVKDFNKVDNAIKKLIAETISLGGAIDKTGTITDKYGNENKLATQALNQLTSAQKNLGGQLDATNKLYTTTTKVSDGVRKGIANMGRSTGQVGIQIQQLVGQIQGGQNAFQAFGAQAADIGIVMGAPLVGVVAAFAAAIAGTLAPALFNGKTELEKLNEQFDLFRKNLNETDEQSKDTFTQVEIGKVNSEIVKTEKTIKKLEQSLIDLSKGFQSNATTSQLLGATSQLAKAEDKLKSLTEQRDKLFDIALEEKVFKDIVELTEANDQLSSSLRGQIIALDKGEKAAFEYGIRQQLNLKEIEAIPPAIQKQINKIFELRQAQKDQAEQLSKNQKQAAKDKADAAKLAQEKKGASSFATGIIQSGESETDRLTRQMDELDSLYMQGLLQQQEYNDAKVAIALQANKIIEDDNKKLAQNELARQNMILGTTASIFGSLAELSKTFQGEQSNTYKALFAVSKGFAIAQAGLNLTTAISQASTLPYPANIPAMANAAAAGGQLVSAISSASYGGGRLYGGGVESDKIYPIAENGRPEVLQQSDGSQYLIGGKGKVIPNGDIGGMSGGGVTINIANNAAGVEVTQTGSSDDGRIINLAVNEVANQINRGQGVIPKALKNSTSTQMRATR